MPVCRETRGASRDVQSESRGHLLREMNLPDDRKGETAKSLPLCKAVSSPSFRYDKSMYCVYLIQHESTKEIYIGITGDPKKRLIQHNSSNNKSTTRTSGQWKLVYAEAYRSKSDATLRERRLKNHGSGKHELIKRLRSSLLDT